MLNAVANPIQLGYGHRPWPDLHPSGRSIVVNSQPARHDAAHDAFHSSSEIAWRRLQSVVEVAGRKREILSPDMLDLQG